MSYRLPYILDRPPVQYDIEKTAPVRPDTRLFGCSVDFSELPIIRLPQLMESERHLIADHERWHPRPRVMVCQWERLSWKQ